MDPYRDAIPAPVSPIFDTIMAGLSTPPDETDNDPSAAAAAADNILTNPSPLRSQAEFLMTGVLPVAAQPERPCSICVENLTEDVVRMARCGHTFHTLCILKWFKSPNPRASSCPNCREELFDTASPSVSPASSEYTPRYGSPRRFGGGVRIWPQIQQNSPTTPFPGTAANNVRFLDRRSAQSGAEVPPRSSTEENAERMRALRNVQVMNYELERDYLRSLQELRLLDEREKDQLRRLQEQIEWYRAHPTSPVPARRAEGQPALRPFPGPQRPLPPLSSAETAASQNEDARERAQNLVRARSMLGPPSEPFPYPRSRATLGPPDSRQAFSAVTTERLEELPRDDILSAYFQRQRQYEAMLALQRTQSDQYASPTAQTSQEVNESARSPETAFGAPPPLVNMRRTGNSGTRSPRRTRGETFARAEVQRREEREAEAIRWQGRLGRLHTEQVTMAAQGPSTSYANSGMPADLPQVRRSQLDEHENAPGLSSTYRYQSLLSERLRGAQSTDRRRSDSPLPEETHGARNRAPANESFRGLLAWHGPEELATSANVIWGPASTRTTPSQDVEDRDAVDGSADDTPIDDFDLAMRWAERH